MPLIISIDCEHNFIISRHSDLEDENEIVEFMRRESADSEIDTILVVDIVDGEPEVVKHWNVEDGEDGQ